MSNRFEYYKHKQTNELVMLELNPSMVKPWQKGKFHLVYEKSKFTGDWILSRYVSLSSYKEMPKYYDELKEVETIEY